MRLETLGIKEVRAAYIEQITPVLQQQGCTQQEFDGMIYFLDNFLTLLEGSNIMLVRTVEDQPTIPEQQLREQSKHENKINVQEILDNHNKLENLEYEEDNLVEDDEEELSAEDAHFRQEYLKHLEATEEDVIVEPPKVERSAPTKFTEKIKQLKTPPKRNEEDDEDEY